MHHHSIVIFYIPKHLPHPPGVLKTTLAMMIFDEVHEDADRKIAEAITGFYSKLNSGVLYITY